MTKDYDEEFLNCVTDYRLKQFEEPASACLSSSQMVTSFLIGEIQRLRSERDRLQTELAKRMG